MPTSIARPADGLNGHSATPQDRSLRERIRADRFRPRRDPRSQRGACARNRGVGPESGRLWNTGRIGAWRSLVARTVRVGEVPGSNPGAPIVEKLCLEAAFLLWLGAGLELAIRTEDPKGIAAQLSDVRRRSLQALGRELDDLELRVDEFVWRLRARERKRDPRFDLDVAVRDAIPPGDVSAPARPPQRREGPSSHVGCGGSPTPAGASARAGSTINASRAAISRPIASVLGSMSSPTTRPSSPTRVVIGGAALDGPRHGAPDRGVRSFVAARAAGRAQRPHVRRALRALWASR